MTQPVYAVSLTDMLALAEVDRCRGLFLTIMANLDPNPAHAVTCELNQEGAGGTGIPVALDTKQAEMLIDVIQHSNAPEGKPRVLPLTVPEVQITF